MTTVTADRVAGTSPNQQWEEVLAALEEDVRRSERKLHEPAQVSNPVLHGGMDRLAPSETQLPGEAAAVFGMPSMPPLESMPPIPAHVETRIRDLRTRIVALQLQLREELAQLRPAPGVTRLRSGVTTTVMPHFFDSTA